MIWFDAAYEIKCCMRLICLGMREDIGARIAFVINAGDGAAADDDGLKRGFLDPTVLDMAINL